MSFFICQFYIFNRIFFLNHSLFQIFYNKLNVSFDYFFYFLYSNIHSLANDK